VLRNLFMLFESGFRRLCTPVTCRERYSILDPYHCAPRFHHPVEVVEVSFVERTPWMERCLRYTHLEHEVQ
jgi:hypothetical protein